MKKRLSVRVEESRLEKLRRVADAKKKTMTQLIEDWIDRLQELQDNKQ
jgi:predicted DNA-binding ribbon-helix-helix protein